MIEDLVSARFKPVDKRDPVSAVLGYVTGESDLAPVVLDGRKVFGVLNMMGVTRSRIAAEQKIHGYAIGTRALHPDSTVEDALDVLATSRLAYAPVVTRDRSEPVGVLHARDLLRRVDADARADGLLLEVPILAPGATVGEALRHFHRVNTSVLPVVDARSRLDAVLRRTDVTPLETDARPDGRKAAAGEVHDPRASPVAGFVFRGFEEVPAAASFAACVAALARGDGHAVVVDGERRPVGVLTPEGMIARLAAARAGRAAPRKPS